MVTLFIISIFISFILTALAGRVFIPVLMSKKLGQPIREIGPRWHKSKEGTPTMGGLFMIAASAVALCVSFFVCDRESLIRLWITFGAAFLFGLIGVIDDAKKLFHHSSDGLLSYEKFILQFSAAAIYIALLELFGFISTVVPLPFLGVTVDFGYFYYVLAVFFICGIVNAVNFTDGIDGLASSVTAVVCAFFAISAFASSIPDQAMLSGVTFGSCLGFLVYNAYPARVFMGDTGSLFLGGIVCGLSFMYGSPLIVFVVGIIYIIETLSVILQVSWFKISHGKRIFKMAPIHHHFEMCGWSENKIVIIFVIITVVMSILAYFLS